MAEEKAAKEEKKGIHPRPGTDAEKTRSVEKKEEAGQKRGKHMKEIKDPWKYLRFAHMTEKSINLIEKENKLVFIVNDKATKKDIKQAFEKAFGVKVDEVKTMIDQKHRKKAFIRLAKEYSAADIAIRLGML